MSLSPFPPLSASSHQIPPLPPSSLFPGRRETAKEIGDEDEKGGGGGGRCHEFTPPARQTDDSWEKRKEEKRKGEEGEKLKPSFRHFSFFSFSVSHENCFLHRLGKGGKGGDDVGAPKGFLTLFEIGRTSEEMASGQFSGKSGVGALAKKRGGGEDAVARGMSRALLSNA